MTSATRQAKARRSREESRGRIIAAATELVRERSYAELSIGEIMDHAGIGRTNFYRHFDDLGDLLINASREPLESLFETELDIEGERASAGPRTVRAALEPAVAVYHRHGPLLRALAEAAPGDERIAAGQEAMRDRFDGLVARWLAGNRRYADRPSEEVGELARALNMVNTSYLLDAFGREPRVSPETALDTLTEIWLAVFLHDRGADDARGPED